jgi:glutamyl-tRNA synthetase
MKKDVRVRFAPSPTGPLHIGGVRTALYNYLFARKYGGTCILRIEDTDQTRYVADSERYILESLAWCGIRFDEGPGIAGDAGPYRQSERKLIYREYADTLLSSGNAYFAFDTQEELTAIRASLEAEGKTFVYNWEGRAQLRNSIAMPPAETKKILEAGTPYVIRFKVPENEVLVLNDIIRGEVRVDSNILDDKILFKSDGMPTYHLANVVDDHLMNISHVIRGEEWLPSLALHILLYKALEWECPEFAHLPLIMKPEGKGKLSKRDGEKLGFPVYPLAWGGVPGYRESGYFPEAVINFLALLGWNPGTEQEIFSMDELINSFSLQRVNKSGARFDPEKTKWYNHQYVQRKNVTELADNFRPFLEHYVKLKAEDSDMKLQVPEYEYLREVVGLLRERALLLTDFWEMGSYFFVAPDEFNPKAVKKHWKADTPQLLFTVSDLLSDISPFEPGTIEEQVKKWIEKEEISLGRVMAPLRLALVGDLKGPHLFEIMGLLGRQGCQARIRFACEQLTESS